MVLWKSQNNKGDKKHKGDETDVDDKGDRDNRDENRPLFGGTLCRKTKTTREGGEKREGSECYFIPVALASYLYRIWSPRAGSDHVVQEKKPKGKGHRKEKSQSQQKYLRRQYKTGSTRERRRRLGVTIKRMKHWENEPIVTEIRNWGWDDDRNRYITATNMGKGSNRRDKRDDPRDIISLGTRVGLLSQ